MGDPHAGKRVERLVEADVALARARAASDEIERHLACWLLPAIALRRTERDLLIARLSQKRDHAARESERDARVRQLEAALDAARFEVKALRTSASWRLTGPLRFLYDRLRGSAGR
jgi:hypothetical protein